LAHLAMAQLNVAFRQFSTIDFSTFFSNIFPIVDLKEEGKFPIKQSPTGKI
jgi:hypothetical protein